MKTTIYFNGTTKEARGGSFFSLYVPNSGIFSFLDRFFWKEHHLSNISPPEQHFTTWAPERAKNCIAKARMNKMLDCGVWHNRARKSINFRCFFGLSRAAWIHESKICYLLWFNSPTPPNPSSLLLNSWSLHISFHRNHFYITTPPRFHGTAYTSHSEAIHRHFPYSSLFCTTLISPHRSWFYSICIKDLPFMNIT